MGLLFGFKRVGVHVERELGVGRVVRGHLHLEMVLAAHPLVHGVREVETGALARLDDRRTYGQRGRSAALERLDLQLA